LALRQIRLFERLDQLVEVLAQLLEESQAPPATSADNQSAAEAPIADLHSENDRAIHVLVNNQKE